MGKYANTADRIKAAARSIQVERVFTSRFSSKYNSLILLPPLLHVPGTATNISLPFGDPLLLSLV